MNLQKCERCAINFHENSVSYYRRTKDLLKQLPCLCRDCQRITKYFNLNEIELDKNIKAEKIKDIKKELKQNVILYDENQHLINSKKDIHEKRKKFYRIQSARIRSARKNAIIKISDEEKIQIRKFYDECPSGHHVDHIIPIGKGGKHCLANLQYLYAKDNIRKGNRIEVDVLEQYLDNEKLSVAFLQRKFKLTYFDAKKILIDLGIINET